MLILSSFLLLGLGNVHSPNIAIFSAALWNESLLGSSRVTKTKAQSQPAG